MTKKAIVLFSGGVDSTTCLAIAKQEGYRVYALSFQYGQRHQAELEAAKKIADLYQVKEHKIFSLDLSSFSGSALTNLDLAVPDFNESQGIPVTYVPARNTIFISLALGYAETLEAYDIFIGSNAVDYSGYPDCRPEYFKAFQTLIGVGTKMGVEGRSLTLHTPLLYLSKKEILRLGAQLKIDYRMTVSCYRSNAAGQACGTCDSCVYRKKGFKEADLEDPTRYVLNPESSHASE